jgi:predicted transcriptional regulator YheO
LSRLKKDIGKILKNRRKAMTKTFEDRISILEKENKDLRSAIDLVMTLLAQKGLITDNDECTVKECAEKAKLHEQTVYKYLNNPKFSKTFKQQGKRKIIFYKRFIEALQGDSRVF